MIDEEVKEVFYEDLREKNSIARSSRVAYQTRSALNNKQSKIKLQRGRPKMIKINYNEYVPYKKFKELPDDLKLGYFQYIVDYYHVGYSALARMWAGEASKETIRKRFNELGVVSSIPEGCNPKHEDTKRFLADYQKPGIKYRELEEKEPATDTPETSRVISQEVIEHIDGSMVFKSSDRSLLEEDFHKFLEWFEGTDTLSVQIKITRCD